MPSAVLRKPPPTKPTPTKAPSKNRFDGDAFSKNVDIIGRPYRHRAMEIIKICRLFSVSSEPQFKQDRALTSALKLCDEAIESAIKSGKKSTHETDDKFERAERALKDYDIDFLKSSTDVETRMEKATNIDTGKDKKPKSRNNPDKPIDVEFHIMSSLPCEKKQEPIIVKQRLKNSRGSLVIPEILWNSSHFPKDEQRLRLAQNPHFYREADLPSSSRDYQGRFERGPTTTYEGRIYVITNNVTPKGESRRVFLDVGGTKPKRAFDNFWMPRPKEPNGTLIFKDVTGKLEGETTVHDSMSIKSKTRFLHHTVRMLPTSRYPHVKRPKPTRDWKAPIRDLLKEAFSHTHLRILGKHS